MSATHPGIRFPDRAEALSNFEGYRVFLEPWGPIATELSSHWSAVALRGSSGILGIHGAQGAGKTLLAKQLRSDFEATKKLGTGLSPDGKNFWHRVAGGSSLNSDLIAEGTSVTEFHDIENKKDWVEKAEAFVKAQHRVGARVLLADNAERAYFRQGLVDVSDVDYIGISSDPALNRLAAERIQLRATLLVVLSNDDLFLLGLQEAVEKQHRGLMSLATLGLADARTKETIIRVNTNRLNPASYWSAIEQAREQDRVALKQALAGDGTFPDSFRAVDTASQTRTGRPARRNVLTLITFAATEDATAVDVSQLGRIKRTEVNHKWMTLNTFEENFAPPSLGVREAGLLESEWVLRVCVLGNPFVRSLLDAANDATQRTQTEGLLERLKDYLGPGYWPDTRDAYTAGFVSAIDAWIPSSKDLTAFWAAGQSRSTHYEPALAALLPGYNTSGTGFLNHRPDYVVADYTPASLMDSLSDDPKAIRAAIIRNAHAFEFTAISSPDVGHVRSYLAGKLPVYVKVTQEQ
jgi:hypothetical protein